MNNTIIKKTTNLNTQTNKDTLTPHHNEVFTNVVSLIDSHVKSILKSDNINDYMLSLTGAQELVKLF